MCNLYQLAPREHVERYFRCSLPPDYQELAVGPYQWAPVCRPGPPGLQVQWAQWGMIAPGSKARRPSSRAILTNNARSESVAQRPTFGQAWRLGQRCLVPCAWYQEPNWETGRNVWWRMRRADGAPWALAGLWSEWADPASGEIVPNFTLLTVNCDHHPLLARLHKPDPNRPPEAQDKRSVVALEPPQWNAWLHGDEVSARTLLKAPPLECFDLHDARRTDALLEQARGLFGAG